MVIAGAAFQCYVTEKKWRIVLDFLFLHCLKKYTKLRSGLNFPTSAREGCEEGVTKRGCEKNPLRSIEAPLDQLFIGGSGEAIEMLEANFLCIYFGSATIDATQLIINAPYNQHQRFFFF
jgi:hypothetical protein